MVNRSADATVKGYYYQFDTTIKHILELQNSNDKITIEGIEDIDINTASEQSTVQCKYLSKPRYVPSVLKDAMILMLEHFMQNSSIGLKYKIYAHFVDEKSDTYKIIKLNDLKKILAYKERGVHKQYHIENDITDDKLELFLKRFELKFGLEFSVQQLKVIEYLSNVFNCSIYEADVLYYNNALRVIIDLAIKKNIKERVITKEHFFKSINCKKILFNDWYLKLKTKVKYLELIKRNLDDKKILLPSREKFLIIGREVLKSYDSEIQIAPFIVNLIEKYFNIGSAFRDAKPITLILELDREDLINVKKKIIINNISYNDGYEDILFNFPIFNEKPVINLNRNAQKIIAAPYKIRIISLETFTTNITNINSIVTILNFSKRNISNPNLIHAQWHDIYYCNTLFDIHKLII